MAGKSTPAPARATTWIDATAAMPPHLFFLVSAIFHYLGPAFAVLLFGEIPVLGVAWLRIASAAVVFAAWRLLPRWPVEKRRMVVALGVVLATMPAWAVVVGIVLLRQLPQPVEVAGVVLVIAGVILHQERARRGG